MEDISKKCFREIKYIKMQINPNNTKKEGKWKKTKMRNHQNKTLRSKKNLRKEAVYIQKMIKKLKNKIQKDQKCKMKNLQTKKAK